MAITKKSDRQSPIAATATFTFADLVSGTYAPAIDLPAGAIVLSGHMAITTIFNSGTDDKFSIGDQVSGASAVGTTYSAQSADITAAGIVALTPTGAKYDKPATVGVLWTATGTAATAGAGRLTITYIVDGRASFTQG